LPQRFPPSRAEEGWGGGGGRGEGRPSASKVEIDVMLRRGDTRNVVGEYRAKARARLDPRVPFFGRLVRIPGHIAEIIEARQVSGGGNVGDREMIAGKPTPALDEVSQVV